MAFADILADHPNKDTFDLAPLNRAVQAVAQSIIACNACADTDLARDPAGKADCIRHCLDCADICAATLNILTRPNPSGDAWLKQVAACIAACEECAEHCRMHDSVCCQECADACTEAQQALGQLVAAAVG